MFAIIHKSNYYAVMVFAKLYIIVVEFRDRKNQNEMP